MSKSTNPVAPPSLKICDCGHFPGSHNNSRGVCLSIGCPCEKYVEQSYFNNEENN